jgi:hypothetical protein
VTLGDEDTKLDSAYIETIVAGSLTLTGALNVGSVVTTGDVKVGGELLPNSDAGTLTTIETVSGTYKRIKLSRTSNVYVIPISMHNQKIVSIYDSGFVTGQRIILKKTAMGDGKRTYIIHKYTPGDGSNILFYLATGNSIILEDNISPTNPSAVAYEFMYDGSGPTKYFIQIGSGIGSPTS